MKIQQITQLTPNKINENKQSTLIKKNDLQNDYFIKSENISFKGGFLDGFFDSLMDDILGDMTTFINDLSSIRKHYQKELRANAIIEVFSNKKYRNFIKTNKAMPIEKLLGLTDSFGILEENLKEAGIRTNLQLDNFLRVFNKSTTTREVFRGQSLESFEIYGLLKSKDDLSNYDDILLYLYNENDKSPEEKATILNSYCEFLKKLGINKSSDFDKNFVHLKPAFNDFEEISDKVEAIDYVKSTYDSKINFLNEFAGKNSAKTYLAICDIVDYLYIKNNGESLDGLQEILDIALSENKFKTQSLKNFFGIKELKNAQDKIDFFKFLKECEVSVNDFNSIVSKSFIENEDNNFFSHLINKKHLSQSIAEIKGSTPEVASEFYRRFSDVINAIYDDESENLDNLRILINLEESLNLKNSEAILRLYQDISGDKSKTITKEQLIEFVQSFAFVDAKNLIDTAKKQKIPVGQILKAEKEKFNVVSKEIESFISSDESAFFAGQTVQNIYKNYYHLFQDKNESVQNILQNIVDFNISTSQQYKQKSEELEKFKKFFPSNDSLLKFINTNEINLEEDSKEYKESCLEILNAVYNSTPHKKVQDRIEFYATSGFLLKSQNRLKEFLEKMPSLKTKVEVLSLIADKKIPSLNQLEKFFRLYNTSNDSSKELLEFLKNLPEDINFSQSTQLLTSLQEKIDELNLPLQINADNINKIDTSAIKKKKEIESSDIISIMNNIHNADENGNFLTQLQASKDTNHRIYDARKIAEELVFKMKFSSESYQNISRLLNLEKTQLGLGEDASDYLHIKAIKESLPKEFVDFVNSTDWLDFSTQGTPNLSLHAKLRAIDRFGLDEATDIKTLYTEETKSKLKNLFSSVYVQTPIDIRGTDINNRIITNHNYNSNVIEAVFSEDGTMITIVPKRHR
ncbi:MAG: hypothetical protein E7Z90_03160 [Cyanobacteria bacterium SIG29]|nr:hypothetical protein [Cyanobacteria bacterium SIG29]